jgi:membrane-bound serine protease (ClpP class)
MRVYQGVCLGLWGVMLLLVLHAEVRPAPTPKLVLMEVSGTIDLGLAPYTRRVLQEAEALGASAVILHINTPGGRVDAAIQMRDALLDAPMDTIAFIDKEAYSAGALIALAARKIYMTGGAVIGAATPVDQQGQKVGEKYVSAIRKLFRATAERNGRPPEVAEAMVDEDVAIPGLIDKGKLLTLTTQEALTWEVADGQIDTLDMLLDHLQATQEDLIRLPTNWAESLVRFLTNPIVSSLLLSLGMLGLLAEVYTVGFGVPGTMGLVSLGLFFGGHYLVGLAGWEEALLIGVGILLFALEIFVIPGFGIVGLLGILAFAAGLFLSFLGRYPTSADLWRAGSVLLVSLVLVGLGSAGMILLLPGMPFWARLRLGTRLANQADERLSQESLVALPVLGMEGITVTPLRPSGTGLFGGQRLDILSEGEYIPAATPVTIVRIEGNRLLVRATVHNQPDHGDHKE